MRCKRPNLRFHFKNNPEWQRLNTRVLASLSRMPISLRLVSFVEVLKLFFIQVQIVGLQKRRILASTTVRVALKSRHALTHIPPDGGELNRVAIRIGERRVEGSVKWPARGTLATQVRTSGQRKALLTNNTTTVHVSAIRITLTINVVWTSFCKSKQDGKWNDEHLQVNHGEAVDKEYKNQWKIQEYKIVFNQFSKALQFF